MSLFLVFLGQKIRKESALGTSDQTLAVAEWLVSAIKQPTEGRARTPSVDIGAEADATWTSVIAVILKIEVPRGEIDDESGIMF